MIGTKVDLIETKLACYCISSCRKYACVIVVVVMIVSYFLFTSINTYISCSIALDTTTGCAQRRPTPLGRSTVLQPLHTAAFGGGVHCCALPGVVQWKCRRGLMGTHGIPSCVYCTALNRCWASSFHPPTDPGQMRVRVGSRRQYFTRLFCSLPFLSYVLLYFSRLFMGTAFFCMRNAAHPRLCLLELFYFFRERALLGF